jgi:hypothetical protein
MPTIRQDEPQPALRQQAHYLSSCLQGVVLTWSEASRLIDNVSVALTLAGYRGDDITRMRTSLEETLSHVLEREQLLGRGRPVHVSYRVNQLQAVVEIQTVGACSPQLVAASSDKGNRPVYSRPKSSASRSFMTSIRYRKQERAATVCDCQLIQ